MSLVFYKRKFVAGALGCGTKMTTFRNKILTIIEVRTGGEES